MCVYGACCPLETTHRQRGWVSEKQNQSSIRNSNRLFQNLHRPAEPGIIIYSDCSQQIQFTLDM